MKKFLMTVALGVAVAFAPAPAVQAQTTPEVLAALGFSQAQIQTVMALLDSQTPVVATGESLLSDHDGVNLQVGVNSTRVMELQACMNAAGFPTGIVDGAFGPNTAAGVRSFQASQGLVVDGIVGVATTPAFQAACPVMVAAPEEPSEPSEPTNPEFPATGGNEASLEDFDLSSEDDAE
jgi:murein L,D-transpeptidase YcbB/YkuD